MPTRNIAGSALLFGAHLDDVSIQFNDRKSKLFASRGQQKRIVLLLKIALAQELEATVGKPVMLLDDFMTDFDGQTVERLVSLLLGLETQLIITIPSPSTGLLERAVASRGYQKVVLPWAGSSSDFHIEHNVSL